jgi:hypothetical protein
MQSRQRSLEPAQVPQSEEQPSQNKLFFQFVFATVSSGHSSTQVFSKKNFCSDFGSHERQLFAVPEQV